MKKTCIITVFLCLLCTIVIYAGESRTWTATTGHTINGSFEKLNGETVHINLGNGKTAKIKLEQLCEADRKYVADMEDSNENKESELNSEPSPFDISESVGDNGIQAVENERVEKNDVETNSDIEAVMTLAKVLKEQNFPYCCLDVSGTLNRKSIKREGNLLLAEVDILVRFDSKKFDKFREVIEPVLDKISSGQREQVTIGRIVDNTAFIPSSSPYSSLMSDPDLSREGLRITRLYVNHARNETLTQCKWTGYDLPALTSALFYCYANIIPVIDVSFEYEEHKNLFNSRHGLPDCTFIPGFSTPCPDNYDFAFKKRFRLGSIANNVGWENIASKAKGQVSRWNLAPLYMRSYSNGTAIHDSRRKTISVSINLEELKLTGRVDDKVVSISSLFNRLKKNIGVNCSIVSDNPEMDQWHEKLETVLHDLSK